MCEYSNQYSNQYQSQNTTTKNQVAEGGGGRRGGEREGGGGPILQVSQADHATTETAHSLWARWHDNLPADVLPRWQKVKSASLVQLGSDALTDVSPRLSDNDNISSAGQTQPFGGGG